jgi:hypothetical protein
MKNHRLWRPLLPLFISVLIATLLLSACVTQPKPGSVYRDWAARMSEMGIFPVFPPREDIVVGDVYFLPSHPYDAPLIEQVGGAGNAGFHKQNLLADFANENLFASLTNYYFRRAIFAPTSTNLDGETTGDSLGIAPLAGSRPDLNKRANVFEFVPPTRLRQVAFPEFSVTTVTEVGLAAMVPIEAVRASIGFSSSDVSRISFKIPQAESYGLPSDYLLQNTFAGHIRTVPAPPGTNLTPQTFLLVSDTTNTFMSRSAPALARAMFNDSALFVAGRLKGSDRAKLTQAIQRMKNYVYLAVISEVYYARSIDINVEFSKARSTSASARPMGMDEINALANFLKGSTNAITQSANTNSTALQPAATLTDVGTNINVFELAAQMRTNNIEMQGSIPGGQVKVVSVGQRNVGLRKKFEQPIAVGVRGLLLKLEIHPTHFKDANGNDHEGFRIITE